MRCGIFVDACRGLSIVAAALGWTLAATGPSACADELPVVDDLFAAAASRTALTHDMPIVAEGDFYRLLSKMRDVRTDESQARAVRMASLVNGPLVLGVEGRVTRPARVDGAAFIVARRASVTPDGIVQSSDFFVVAMPLRGEVAWAALESVVVTSQAPVEATRAPFTGCAPIDTGRPASVNGFPPEVILNLEARARPRNASSQTIELHLFSNASGTGRERTERAFVCASPIGVKEEPGGLPGAKSLQKFASELRLPPDAVVISERDFYRTLAKKQELTMSKESRRAAARIVTAASEASALGLEARVSKARRFSSSLVVVARDAAQRGGTLGTREFYVVPMTLSGDASWVGRDVRLGFGGDRPKFDLEVSPCGPVFTSMANPEGPEGFTPGGPIPEGIIPGCDNDGCIGGSHPWLGDRGGVGLGTSGTGTRPTVRLFGRSGDRLDVEAIACEQFLSPPEREARECGRTDDGQVTTETCNGRDDDCNGQVDEGGVCDILPTTCPPQPRTCGAISCGDIPDGIGGVVHCGAPCP